MTLAGLPEPIDDRELLARFIVQPRHLRVSDSTVRPEAFVPFRHTELSVTRHGGLSSDEICALGQDVARIRERPLLGRADVLAIVYRHQGLGVLAAPLPRNPYHANVTGWPEDKEAQKLLAVEIAERAHFQPCPVESVLA